MACKVILFFAFMFSSKFVASVPYFELPIEQRTYETNIQPVNYNIPQLNDGSSYGQPQNVYLPPNSGIQQSNSPYYPKQIQNYGPNILNNQPALLPQQAFNQENQFINPNNGLRYPQDIKNLQESSTLSYLIKSIAEANSFESTGNTVPESYPNFLQVPQQLVQNLDYPYPTKQNFQVNQRFPAVNHEFQRPLIESSRNIYPAGDFQLQNSFGINRASELEPEAKATFITPDFPHTTAPLPLPQNHYIKHVISQPHILNALASNNKRYLIIHPNGTIEKADSMESVKQAYSNYYLVNSNEIAFKTNERGHDENKSEMKESIRSSASASATAQENGEIKHREQDTGKLLTPISYIRNPEDDQTTDKNKVPSTTEAPDFIASDFGIYSAVATSTENSVYSGPAYITEEDEIVTISSIEQSQEDVKEAISPLEDDSNNDANLNDDKPNIKPYFNSKESQDTSSTEIQKDSDNADKKSTFEANIFSQQNIDSDLDNLDSGKTESSLNTYSSISSEQPERQSRFDIGNTQPKSIDQLGSTSLPVTAISESIDTYSYIDVNADNKDDGIKSTQSSFTEREDGKNKKDEISLSQIEDTVQKPEEVNLDYRNHNNSKINNNEEEKSSDTTDSSLFSSEHKDQYEQDTKTAEVLKYSNKDDNQKVVKENNGFVSTSSSLSQIKGSREVAKPIVWFRTDDVNFWDKITSGDEKFDLVYFYNINPQPIVARDLKTTIYPNGTTVEELTETTWNGKDDKEPKIITTIKVIPPNKE